MFQMNNIINEIIIEMKKSTSRSLCFIFVVYMLTLFPGEHAFAQNDSRYIRIANVIVDSNKLESYKAALKEGIETAMHIEPGVLMLYAVYDKNNPTHITVFEIYADKAAYQYHIQTAHFKKYKSTVESMVKSLTLTDVDAIALQAKQVL